MLRKILFPALLAAAFPALAAPADTHERVLPNGLRVIVKEDHRAPVVTAQVSYKIGSADEIAGKTGLSHALEHMMFKGTKTVPAGEYTRRISALGGQDNAYTSKERTVYFVKIAAQHLPEVLKLEADRMANLNFSNDVFNNEMKVIREERRERTEDSPEGRLYENMIGRAWQKSPNKTGVIGTMKDLHALKADDLRRWYKQWYAPNNATLVVVGDVQPETPPAARPPQHRRTDAPQRAIRQHQSTRQTARHHDGMARTAPDKNRRQTALRAGHALQCAGRPFGGAFRQKPATRQTNGARHRH